MDAQTIRIVRTHVPVRHRRATGVPPRGRAAPVRGLRAGRYSSSPAAFAAHQHAEAVVLDLVQPARTGGRLGGWAGQAGLAEIGEGYAAQEHAV